MPGTNIANCSVPAAGLELRGTITTTALYFCEAIVTAAPHFREPIDMMALQFREPIGLGSSVVLESRDTIVVAAAAECSRRKLSWNERCIFATNHATLRKLRH